MIKILLVALAVVIVVVGGLLQHREKGIALAALLVLLTFTGDVLSEVAADMIKPLFFGGESTSEETGDRSVVQGEAGLSPAPEAKPEAPPESAAPPDAQPESKPEAPPESAAPDRSEPESGTPPEPEPEPPEVPADPLEGVPDISGQRSVSGSLTEQGQEVQYQYTAPTSGRYQFDAGLGYGPLSLEVCNAYGGWLFGNSGYSCAAGELEAGKTYLVRVKYGSRPTDYTIEIGVPNPVTDVSGQISVSGSITYREQIDIYTYTAPVSGVYLFDSGLSYSALSVSVKNAQGETISRDSSSAHATLEEGKCYTLLVACTTSLLDYTVQFYTPQPIFDITAQSAASGMLTYQYQRDQYTYVPPADGRYCFDTGVSYGGVSMEVKDQAGRRVDGGRNALTVSLRAGELYTLSVFQEYMSLPAEYTVSVTAQQDPA